VTRFREGTGQGQQGSDANVVWRVVRRGREHTLEQGPRGKLEDDPDGAALVPAGGEQARGHAGYCVLQHVAREGGEHQGLGGVWCTGPCTAELHLSEEGGDGGGMGVEGVRGGGSADKRVSRTYSLETHHGTRRINTATATRRHERIGERQGQGS
jgi:hypothetical protein